MAAAAATAAALAAEVDRAAKEATEIVATLVNTCTTGPALELHDDPRAWHRSECSLAEAYALLWLQDTKGGLVSKKSDDSLARLYAAHLIDLILVGRVKLYWASKESMLNGKEEKLRLMVASTEAVSVASTTAFLQYMQVAQEDRLKKGKNPISVAKLIRDDLMWHTRDKKMDLQTETFTALVDRGILAKEKQKQYMFFKKTIYRTKNAAPKSVLVKDLRAVLKQETSSTTRLELLLKLIAKTTKVLTAEEEASDKDLRAVRKAFKDDAGFTLVKIPPATPQSSDNGQSKSPFLPSDELSSRLLVNQAELA